jgi:hypothetical protein
MMVLGSSSKYLDESDFYRVGPKLAGGTHLEGWMPVGGISRVVADRNAVTLAPTGRYYVQFDSLAAARTWQAELSRLWRQAKEHTPGLGPRRGSHGGSSVGLPGPGPLLVVRDHAADAMRAAEVAAFTLVAPGMRWDLGPARFTAAERFLERRGAPLDHLRRAAGSDFLVLVAVETGRISAETLRSAIRADGEERGLAWRVRGLEQRFASSKKNRGHGPQRGKGGIMPFGNSFLKGHDHPGQDQGVVNMETGADPNNSAANPNEEIAPSFENGVQPDDYSNEAVSTEDMKDVGQHNHNNGEASLTDMNNIDQHHPNDGEATPKDMDAVDLSNESAFGTEVVTDNELTNIIERSSSDQVTTYEEVADSSELTSGDEVNIGNEIANDSEVAGNNKATTKNKAAHSNRKASSKNKAAHPAITKKEKHADKYRIYPRFVVPFLDEAEARRFVRNWHRRELRLQMSEEEGDRSAFFKTNEKQPRKWMETRVLNVSYLW